MASKRGSKAGAGVGGGVAGGSSGALFNAVVVGIAFCGGLALLISRGHVAWPPRQLMASLYTVAGCLALVGPVVLARREPAEGGLGELLWMTGGLLLWVFDAVSVLQSDWRSTPWATPLTAQAMGLTILAVLIAGWRCRVSAKGWGWTNVTGWLLGIFWVGLAVSSLWPARGLSLAAR